MRNIIGRDSGQQARSLNESRWALCGFGKHGRQPHTLQVPSLWRDVAYK